MNISMNDTNWGEITIATLLAEFNQQPSACIFQLRKPSKKMREFHIKRVKSERFTYWVVNQL
ncbi:hypothetical protein P4637_09640 [Halalkalibacterium halodurans]|uniref:hypothetical protein n=1 Tax=Halalkalibacterium halodurans TaxID=86665 RepID=UPI00059EFB16|nr:hypothetical protein [Halalkalibacterium halodurans]MDY7222855.1 hypothetical protein [Halalkalibacterium halodurans]MDY7242076.1 hypothetical protein [Halalkalibacterium halodurans]MED3648553.1 hypothetical protein [Halalkalibacterium halodurans]MED4080914.1 hypothetical protein [Halalkalibacterium halodurans]MED4085097.1 hypothetical protein [Halalkalibacterium halodurans]